MHSVQQMELLKRCLLETILIPDGLGAALLQRVGADAFELSMCFVHGGDHLFIRGVVPRKSPVPVWGNA